MRYINDILTNDDGSFKEKDGDFVFGFSEEKILSDLLISAPGHYKEFPTLGINVSRFTNANTNKQIIAREISVGMKADVFKKPIIDLSKFPSEITVNNEKFDLQNDKIESINRLEAPSNLIGSNITSSSVNLSWINNSENQIGFSIEQSIDNISFNPVATVEETQRIITGLSSATNYWFRVRSLSDTVLNSNYSNTLMITTL